MRFLVAAFPFLGFANTLRFDDNEEPVDTKNRPVSRVIKLLEEMSKQLDVDAKNDEEVYDKMSCWCKKNEKEKTASIKAAEQSIKQLTAKIESLTAQTSRLTTEIDDLNKEINESRQALDKATALRAKQLAEFNAEEKDLVQAIQSLKSAIVVLSKHHSMLQGGEEPLYRLAATLSKHLERADLDIPPSQRRKLKAFIQAPAYNSQSGEIFGILKNMSENFSSNLAQSQKEEAENLKAFNELKAAKLAEIEAAQEQVDAKTVENANASEANAQAKKEREDTENSLEADEVFLADLIKKCKMTDEEWEQRQKTRQEEQIAISQAIQVLSSDDVRDNFTNAFNFLQTDKKSSRTEAAEVLFKVADKWRNPKISSLAMSAKLDAFKKVKLAIDEMIEALNAEKADEVRHKDWCTDKLNTNKNNMVTTERDRQDEQAHIDQLNAQINTLTELYQKLHKEIEDLTIEKKRAGEDREKQNNEFAILLKEQRDARATLERASNFLKRFYEKSAGTALAQEPKGFDSYKKKEGGNTAIAMILQIINDTKAMEAELVHDEEESQKAYETFVQNSNRSLKEKKDQTIDTDAERAQAKRELSEAESSHAALVKELEELTEEKADLHKSCDFVLKNFDIRQKARDEEIEALRQAKSILSGSNFKNFLQKLA